MAITPREALLVKDGWEIAVMPNYEKYAMDFFIAIFAREPAIMDRFPFLKELPAGELVENNQRLQKHATIALLMAGDAVASLIDAEAAEQVKRRLRLLGRLHVKFGMKDSYFPVVRLAFLDMLKKAFRSLWNEELEKGWVKAIHIVTHEMAEGLKEGYAHAG